MSDHISNSLEKRRQDDSYRVLKEYDKGIDFCSNDYLGFARSTELKKRFLEVLQSGNFKLGATGSRLITGNTVFAEELEKEIAVFHKAEAGLLFNSGYDANLGLLSSLPQRGDTIITDQLVHASIIDGVRLSRADRFSFFHNDLNALEEKLKLAKGVIYVVVESVYSMDGDQAPLREIAELTEKYSARLIVDEAHATGLFGDKGSGLVCEAGLEEMVFARVITFGKALGSHGAIILGKTQLREYLINFARSFIYTTAAPPYTHIAVQQAYRFLPEKDHARPLKKNIELFTREFRNPDYLIPSSSAIQSLLIEGNSRAKEIASYLTDKGFELKAILSPTVPPGQERLRICLHTYNSDTDILNLVKAIKEIL